MWVACDTNWPIRSLAPKFRSVQKFCTIFTRPSFRVYWWSGNETNVGDKASTIANLCSIPVLRFNLGLHSEIKDQIVCLTLITSVAIGKQVYIHRSQHFLRIHTMCEYIIPSYYVCGAFYIGHFLWQALIQVVPCLWSSNGHLCNQQTDYMNLNKDCHALQTALELHRIKGWLCIWVKQAQFKQPTVFYSVRPIPQSCANKRQSKNDDISNRELTRTQNWQASYLYIKPNNWVNSCAFTEITP